MILNIFGILFFGIVTSLKDSVTLQRENEVKSLMNQSADPCVDFHEYACGNFGNIYPIPDYKGKFEMMTRLSEKNFKTVDRTLSTNLKEARGQSDPQIIDKAKIFYASCQNITEINRRGVEPLLELLNSLGGWPALDQTWSKPDFDWLQFSINVSLKLGNNYLFDSYLAYDIFNTTGKRIFHFGTPQTAISGKNATMYRVRVSNTLKKFNLTDMVAERIAEDIIAFEKALMNLGGNDPGPAVKTIADINASNNKMNWTRFLSGVYRQNFASSDMIGVSDPQFFDQLPNFLERKGAKRIVTFVLWNVVDQLLAVLNDQFVDVINKYNEEAQGYQSAAPRWRACMDIMTDVMNTVTGSILFRKILPRHSKRDTEHMTDIIKSTIREFLLNSSWPGVETRNQSLKKLNKFGIDTSYVNFLYNDSILEEEYRNAKIDYDKFFESYLSLQALKIEKLARVYRTNSKETLWPYPLINADGFYDRSQNTMALHPGLLQSPYYHENFTKTLQYSGLGMVISHEIFHSFDDNGAFFDANKRYKLWWKDEDFTEFVNRTKCFDQQYKNYSLNGIKVNLLEYGNSENIADNMALKFAYMAYDKWLQNNPQLSKNDIISELQLSNRQIFFVSLAQSFCVTLRPEAIEYELSTDPHAPGKYRVIGLIVNSPEFAEQFQCAKDSPMNPNKKCSIW